MDKIIDTKGKWVLYDNGDISYNPQDRDYWIDTNRLQNLLDLKRWVNGLRRKTWFDHICEYHLELIAIESFRLRGLYTEDLHKQIAYATYLY